MKPRMKGEKEGKERREGCRSDGGRREEAQAFCTQALASGSVPVSTLAPSLAERQWKALLLLGTA